MSCENIPSLLDLQKVKKHADDFGRLMGTGEGDSTNEVTGQVRPTYNKVMKGLGYTRIGTFASGGTLTTGRQTLLWDVADGGDGQEYGWSGSFLPSGKVVPPGSTPLTTGGIAVGAWMSRFDPELRVQVREALRRSYAEAGYNLVAGSFEAGGTLVNANDVLLQERTGKAFTGPAGNVPAGTNPTSGGFISRANAPQLDKSDIAKFGYVYGSGLDGKNAVLEAITATGKAHISGPCTLSSFEWPRGARLTGKAAITYTRLPTVACELDSERKIDHGLLKAVYVHRVFDICEMLQLKTAGFNTILHYGQAWANGGNMTKACNAAEAIGLKVILGSTTYGTTNTPAMDLDSRECVMGYYLFDEPQLAGVTKATQDARVAAFRALTNKMLCMTDHGVFSYNSATLSSGFDVIFCNGYWDDRRNDHQNKFDIVMAWSTFKHKAPNTKIIPCLGTFSTNGGAGSDFYKNKPKQIGFAKKFFGMGDGEYLAFAWESNLIIATHKTPTNDTDFYREVLWYNSRPKQKPYELYNIVFYTDVMANLMVAYNDKYSNTDVTPFQTTNAGSIVNERQTAFKAGGIAARNAGGIFALNTPCHGYAALQLYYNDYANNNTASLAITTSLDDFFTNVDRLSTTVANGGSWIDGVELFVGTPMAIRFAPTVTNTNRWKFLAGGIVDCSWRGETF